MQKMAEMRKFDRLMFLRDFDLFPTAERLLSVERKYGDSLSHMDLYGVPELSKRKKQQMLEEQERKRREEEELQRQRELEEASKYTSAYGARMKEATQTMNFAYMESLKNRQEKDFIQTNIDNMDATRGSRPLKERIQVPEGAEVYLYSGQKHNVYEF